MLAGSVAILELANHRMDEIVEPYGDRRRHHFALFRFEPALDVVVPFPFVRLQPEFAGDFYFGFHAGVIDFDRVPHLADVTQSFREVVAGDMPGESSDFAGLRGTI